MPRKLPTEKERAEFRKLMGEMATARIEMFGATAPKYANVLGEFKAALKKSGFSDEESMQIILRMLELPGRRPMMGPGFHGHWREER
jgi:hypothetical protein